MNAKMKVSRAGIGHIVPGDVLQGVERGVGEGGGAGLVPHHHPAQVRGQAAAASYYFHDNSHLQSIISLVRVVSHIFNTRISQHTLSRKIACLCSIFVRNPTLNFQRRLSVPKRIFEHR